MRSTLHLIQAEDYPWLHGLTAPIGEAAGRRRLPGGCSLEQAERATGIIEPSSPTARTRAELAEPLAAAGIATEGQAMPHLLAFTARRGLIVQTKTEDGRDPLPVHP